MNEIHLKRDFPVKKPANSYCVAMLVTKYDERQCFGNTFIRNVLRFSRKMNNCNRKLNCAIREDDVYFEKNCFFQKKPPTFRKMALHSFRIISPNKNIFKLFISLKEKNRIKIKENKNFIYENS